MHTDSLCTYYYYASVRYFRFCSIAFSCVVVITFVVIILLLCIIVSVLSWLIQILVVTLVTLGDNTYATVFFQFTSMSLAQGEGYVEAWVGGRTLSTSTPVKRFYGTLSDDRTVNSTNNFMIVVYSSYGISTNSFSAQWTAGWKFQKLPFLFVFSIKLLSYYNYY